MAICENIFINNWPINHRNRLISWSKMHVMSEEILEKVELKINPFKKVSDLSYIEQQMLEIARVFFVERVEVIILDEPTGPLAIHEVGILFGDVDFWNTKSHQVTRSRKKCVLIWKSFLNKIEKRFSFLVK